ncbi:restriction endonuclease subunit S [Staphylococcus delphini]
MTDLKKNVPELRFPEFEGEWEENRIGEMAGKIQSGGTPKTSETKYWDGELPWIQSSDLIKGRVTDVKINKYITVEGLEQSSAKLIPANSIAIVTRVGVGKIAIVNEEFSTSQDFLNLSEINIDSYFALYRLYLLLKKEASSLQGTSIKGITKNDLISKVIKIPRIREEQQKIGDFFSKLDRQIELEEQKLALLIEQKKGYMQKIFSQELRFKDDNGNDYPEWETNTVGELVSNSSEKYIPKASEQLKDIELDSIESNTGRLISIYDSSEFSSQKNKFEKNQVLYGKLRPYLNKFHFTIFNGVCSSEIWVLTTKNNTRLKNEFIYNFIQTNKFSRVANQAIGSKMPRADWNLIENIRLNTPSLNEQQKIGDFFSKLDRHIELQGQKIENLKQRKQGLLQKMFV